MFWGGQRHGQGLRSGLNLCLWILAPAAMAGGVRHEAGTVVERRLALMGTWAWVRVECGERVRAAGAAEAALRAMEAAEADLSTWRRDTLLTRLNGAEPGRRVRVRRRVARELRRALALWRDTGGAFNPAMGPLVRAWGLRTGGGSPSSEELKAALAASDPLALEVGTDWARRLAPGLELEEGGWAKGAALDRALAAAEDPACRQVTVGLGGQVAWSGGWLEIAVAHPRERGRVVGTLFLPPGSVATSGDGVRPGHILDPATGRPAPDFGSVTVWASSGLDADALATALFVMGSERGLAWVERRRGVEALYLLVEEGTLRIRASSGLVGSWSAVEGRDGAGGKMPPARRGGAR